MDIVQSNTQVEKEFLEKGLYEHALKFTTADTFEREEFGFMAYGYSVYGELKDYPIGFSRYDMFKRLG